MLLHAIHSHSSILCTVNCVCVCRVKEMLVCSFNSWCYCVQYQTFRYQLIWQSCQRWLSFMLYFVISNHQFKPFSFIWNSVLSCLCLGLSHGSHRSLKSLWSFVLSFANLRGIIFLVMCCEGADMDVCLTNYGHCNYISGKHACIFYDEVWALKLLCFLNVEEFSTSAYQHIGRQSCEWRINGLCVPRSEYQALRAAQLQRARHHRGQRLVLVWLLWESFAVSTQRTGGQSSRHHPWVHLILT